MLSIYKINGEEQIITLRVSSIEDLEPLFV